MAPSGSLSPSNLAAVFKAYDVRGTVPDQLDEEFARAHGLDASVAIVAQAMTTDGPASFEEKDMRQLVGFDMAARAADQVRRAQPM